MPREQEQYRGVVVSGEPLDMEGITYVHDAPYVRFRLRDEPPPLAPLGIMGLTESTITTTQVVLEWTRGLRMGGKISGYDVDFWVPPGKDVYWAINTLIQNHRTLARRDRAERSK